MDEFFLRAFTVQTVLYAAGNVLLKIPAGLLQSAISAFRIAGQAYISSVQYKPVMCFMN